MPTAARKDVLTTGEVARICHVAPRTVSKWFDTGKLRGYRIPGSRDRRIPRQQLEAFMRAHGIPLGELDGGTCRVLLVDGQADRQLLEALKRCEHYEFRLAANGFQAGVEAEKFRPHAIVLDVGKDPSEAAAFCRSIKELADLRGAKILAAGMDLDQARRDWLMGEGFDGILDKPYSPAQLAEAIEKATDLID
jgi:excisionase family DNA binding protein